MRGIELKQGEKYGRWEVIEPAPTVNKEKMYKCRCECGTVKNVSSKSLRYGKSISCGCYNRERVKETASKRIKDKNNVDLTGQKFEHLTVIKKVNDKTGVNARWLCSCDCGDTTIVIQSNLTSGLTTSCGHIFRENASRRIKKSMGIAEGTNASVLISKKKRSNNSSGARGVSKRGSSGKYQAYIGFKGELYNLGYYETLDEAVAVRKKAEKEVHKNFLEWYFKNINSNLNLIEKKNDVTKIKGVTYEKATNKYVAQITFEKKTYRLGSYAEPEEAIMIRLEAEREKDNDFSKWYEEKIKPRLKKKKIYFDPGQIIENWEIVEPVEGKTGNYYKCKCTKCGAEKEIMAKYIKKRAYACNECRNADLTGKIYKNVKVIEKRHGNASGTFWLCECMLCGKQWEVKQHSLLNGDTTSCGCYKRSICKERCTTYFGMEEGTNVSRLMSSSVSKRNTSGINGVSYNKKSGKYRAYIGFKRKLYNLGEYANLEDAANARKEAEKKLYGDFLKWYSENYPEQWERINRKRKDD